MFNEHTRSQTGNTGQPESDPNAAPSGANVGAPVHPMMTQSGPIVVEDSQEWGMQAKGGGPIEGRGAN
eukprot:7832538-Pyramimonas_sp.AAC.2